jgi:hypothetical protein
MNIEPMKKRKLKPKHPKNFNTPLGVNKRAKNSRNHAINRAKERYDLDLSQSDIERIEIRIRQGHEVLLLDKRSQSRTIWALYVNNIMCVVVYNKDDKCLATFLPVWYAKRYFDGFGLPNYDYEYDQK